MKVKEYIAKEILKKYNIKVPKGFVVKSVDEVNNLNLDFDEIVLKAQVLVGKRGRAGGIILTNKQNLKKDLEKLFQKEIYGEKVEEVLIEEKVNFQKEIYISAYIDTFEREIYILFSEEGGIDVEEKRERVKRFKIDEIDFEIAKKIYKIMKDLDAELVEINPLVISNNEFIALDAKIIIDDNSLFRHEEFRELKKLELNEIEEIAFENDLHYVDLDGEVGIVSVGAGLTMATMDYLASKNYKPAFFLDLGGGASVEKTKAALKIIKIRNPKLVVFNIFGGITRCDEIAKAIVEEKLEIPFIIRIVGTNEEEAKKILEENKIIFVDSIEEI